MSTTQPDEEGNDLVVPLAVKREALVADQNLVSILQLTFDVFKYGTVDLGSFASFLGIKNDLPVPDNEVIESLNNIEKHLVRMSGQLDAIESKIDLLFQESLRIKFETVQLVTEENIAIIKHQFDVMTDMINEKRETEWIDGERLRSVTSEALTLLMSSVDGDYGLLTSLVKISSAMENDVSDLREYWSAIEIYRSCCKSMMIVALTVLSYCNELQGDALSNSTFVTHAKSVVNSIESMYTRHGVAPQGDAIFLHMKNRKYVLAKFPKYRKEVCTSDDWEENVNKTGRNFIADCHHFLFGSPNNTGSNLYGTNEANYYSSMSIYNELVTARDAYLASRNYGVKFEKAFEKKGFR